MLNIQKKTLIYGFLGLTVLVIFAIWLLKPDVEPIAIQNQLSTRDLTADIKVAKPTAASKPVSETKPVEEKSDTLEETTEEISSELTPHERLEFALQTLSERIDEDDSELLHPSVGVDDTNIGLRRELLAAIDEDPTLLNDLLITFQNDPNSKLGREISAVLSATGSPEAQSLSLDIATDTDNYDDEQRAAALFVISEMETITPETRDGLLVNIQQETDSELTQFSLMALKSAPSTYEEYEQVHEVLQTTATSSDSNVRRHAAYQIGEWATSDADLAPLRDIATQDVDANTRVRALQSLASSGFKTDENKSVLWAALNDDSEYAPTRQVALEALRSYPLSDSERESFNELTLQIEQEIELFNSSLE